jgi:hypothetical protein
MIRFALGAALVLLAVAACDHYTPGSGSAAGAAATGTLVTFTRTGGFAGFKDTLVVGKDGSLTLTDKMGSIKKGTATAGDVQRLNGLLTSSAFKTLAPSYAASGADHFTYTVAVPGGVTLSMMDGATAPAIWTSLITEFDGLYKLVK